MWLLGRTRFGLYKATISEVVYAGIQIQTTEFAVFIFLSIQPP